MRKKNINLIGKNCKLIPYTKDLVELYHRWISNEEMLLLTASEPLSLKEEYEMQQDWMNDEFKLTFIVYDLINNIPCGDVNIFYNDQDFNDQHKKYSGEIEIMIAEKISRNQGIAQEALKLMMDYANKYIKTNRFYAKINNENINSVNLFTKKLQFNFVVNIEAFNESTYELLYNNDDAKNNNVTIIIY